MSLKSFFLLCLCLLSISCVVNASPPKQIQSVAQSLSSQILKEISASNLSVAVMPFENSEGKVTHLGQMISDKIAEKILDSKKMKVVDRKDLDKVYKEWKLNLTGAVNSETTQKIGEMTGASYLLVGSIQKMGGREMLFFSKLVRTESAEIHQAATTSIKADEQVLLLNRPVEPSEDSGEDVVMLSKKGEKDCVWVETPAIVRFGTDETKNQARARAIVRARQKAMTVVLGEDVIPDFANFADPAFRKETSLIENVLVLTRHARITEEKIIDEGLTNAKDCQDCRYRVLVQDCISVPKKKVDEGFQVSLDLNKTEFKEGEEAQTMIHSSRNAYIYLLSVDTEWNQITAFPNSAAKDNFIKANEIFTYPNQKHKRMGIHLVAELPSGTEFSAETFRVLATKQPIPESILKEKKYTRLIEKLDDSKIDWSDASSAFTIQR